ncbi:tetratricopeptide repeat protein [Luteibacter aegosomatis]|uniref:tetratricopeptide repeat protein n=1 Tax=Luteibacter aegosomatis TaxID=2911537 RepID=UPI001FF93C91|nr:tetratricopeptide repeat protein [Luteibacter aegosomatis]UPG86709.1 tetratricopeptide repeat protein [Luteibacter aegosomatis]
MSSAQSTSEHIFDATTAGFENDVVQASMQTPILVDLWAEWCGPCKSLGPILEKLAVEYNGAFRLAKVDVDAEQQIAAAFQVRSIPTVMLVSGGGIADGFTGALPEGQVREFLARNGIEPREAGEPAAEAPAAVESPEDAINRIQQAIAAEPDRAELKLDLALALMRAGRVEPAQAELDALPANLATDARAVRLRSQLELARALAGAPGIEELRQRVQANDADWEARDLLGVRLLIEGDEAAGLDQFLDVLKRQRDWNDGQAKKRLLAAFATLDDAELVGTYRRKMASLLF